MVAEREEVQLTEEREDVQYNKQRKRNEMEIVLTRFPAMKALPEWQWRHSSPI